MKQSEIQKCAVCGLGLMHGGNVTAYRFKVDHLVMDLRAIQRQHGLEQFLGSAPMAAIMGPNEDLAKEITTAVGLVCEPCAIETPIAVLLEIMARKDPA